VGTPKGGLTRYEKSLIDQPWHRVRDGVEVKLLAEENEVYVLTQSRDRVHKERSMRRRQLKRLWERLHGLAQMQLTRDELLLKLEQLDSNHPQPGGWWTSRFPMGSNRFSSRCVRQVADVRRREGRYLCEQTRGRDPAEMWAFYTQLVQVEEAFKTLKGDLAIRPIHHQKEKRIEAHIFVAFLAYALHVTLRRRCEIWRRD